MYERIDLHTHSTCSDGELEPSALVALAAERQVQLLALTDHDTVAGCAAAALACAQAGIGFLSGCELTSLWRGREIHIVGLRVDTASAALQGYLAEVCARRVARIEAIGARLTRCGLDGTGLAAAVLALPGTPTRMHMARLLCERGHASDAEDAFQRWLGTGQRAYVAPDWPGIEAAVGAITAAGGVAVLAHPHRYKVSGGARRELCEQFRAAGGQGLEVSLAGMSMDEANHTASLARRYGLAGSAGSDFHTPGVPWRPLGRWLKLPEGITPITELLGLAPAATAAAP
jgi:predicted metal-dependent phosphoesterase TrpH